MTVLLLGGTGDARQIAGQLADRQVDFVYSVAGLVRIPVEDYPVISGGFSQFGGLPAYMKQAGISAIIDATHPYAVNMSLVAQQAANDLAVPCWRYERPPWQPVAGDCWHGFQTREALFAELNAYQSVFITAGQVSERLLQNIAAVPQVILRTAARQAWRLPDNVTLIEAIGPFMVDQERDLFQRYRIDVLVSKNSGGKATAAKIRVARELGIPVFMLNRPASLAAEKQSVCNSIEEVISHCMESL